MTIDINDMQNWSFNTDFEKISWAIFDCKDQSMNTLGERSLLELDAIISEVERLALQGESKGLILLSKKQGNFIAGADINEFEKLDSEQLVKDAVGSATKLFKRIEKLNIPVVAAIDGFCLGGGLELAMACHYRIATRGDNTRIGLPEVKLGIIPGLHGTVRMLRLAGPINGMSSMLTGRMLKAPLARRFGLVDQLVPSGLELRWAARRAVLQKRRTKAGKSWMHKLLRLSLMRKLLASQMRNKTRAKVREDHYPGPFKLIDLFEKHGGSDDDMFSHETDYFAPLMISEQSKNLRRVFKISEMMKALAPKDIDYKPRRAHVIGAGTMGADIAAWCVICGMEVTLQDMSTEALAKAQKRSKKQFIKKLKKPLAVETAMARLIADPDGKGVGRADIIIEAIVENLEIKQKLFQGLETNLKEGAVLSTNTSSLPLEDIANGLKDPGRLIGIHFFNPVAQMPLVEVIKSDMTRKEEVEKGCAFVTAIKKYPLIAKSNPGFLVNRVLAPYLFEAMRQYEINHIPMEKIDQAAVEFGMPMGPIELADMVGLDVCLHVSKTLNANAPKDSELARLVEKGKTGKKSGEGFYVWQDGKAQKEQMEFEKQDLDKLADILIEPLLTECERCYEDKIVDNKDLIDAGVIFGTGFAPFRGGPLHYLENKKQAES